MIKVNAESIEKFLKEDEINKIRESLDKAVITLESKEGEGSDFLGWVDYPITYDKNELKRIKEAALTINRHSECLVVIGIGGSYLGAKAAISALSPYFTKEGVEIIFAGNSISSTYLSELRDYLFDKDFSVNVISKSGTTTEPALTYRVLFELLKKRYMKEEFKEHIFFTTDKEKGALREIGLKEGYEMFTVPSDMGGRYSVLSAVGLLPIASAGIDIDKMLEGARDAFKDLKEKQNPAYDYALVRNALYKKGYKIEIMESYEPKLSFISEWWKQLFGESEGKDHKGIFPASCTFTTDLHSMGQYIQEGERHLFETRLHIEEVKADLDIPFDKDNLDGLNYLAGKSVDYVNKTAEEATAKAHIDGGVPEIKISIPKVDAYNLGYLFYFFEKACALSGYTLDVNPFNQPGVEAYKKNMFVLLKKPGYEE
ncbi:MAG: glucose-6-phosphate isomerase [Bacillales bacterium]|nr:glucose-6-phosphate isomerase [Bacillales bacterium]